MPSEDANDPKVLVGLAVVTLLVFAYSALIVQRILLGAGIVVWLLVLYLLWRFVRAHERIATALEAGSESGGRE